MRKTKLLTKLRVVLAPLDNVPPRGEDAAVSNAKAVLAERPDMIVFTECWKRATYTGLRLILVAAGYRFFRVPGQSVVIAWKPSAGIKVRAVVMLLHGVVAGAFGVVSDARQSLRVLFSLPAHRARRLLLVGAHPAPKASRRGKVAMRLASAARSLGWSRLLRIFRGASCPVIVAMDANDAHPPITAGSVGRHVRDVSDPEDEILHVILIDGLSTMFEVDHVERKSLPQSDHHMIVVDCALWAAR